MRNGEMIVKCEKCGHEIDGESPICMYCGSVLPDSVITQETNKRMVEKHIDEIVKNKESNIGVSLKAFGAILIIIGFIADIISMFLIFSADFSSYGAITIFGTIMFLIGIAIVANS